MPAKHAFPSSPPHPPAPPSPTARSRAAARPRPPAHRPRPRAPLPRRPPLAQAHHQPHAILDRVLDRAAIAKWDPRGEKLDIHALRPTFATRMARAGLPLSHAQAALGHSDPKLTAQVYTHLQAEDLRCSLAALAELPRAREPMPGAQAPHTSDQRPG